jgi:hypothetical protein
MLVILSQRLVPAARWSAQYVDNWLQQVHQEDADRKGHQYRLQ